VLIPWQLTLVIHQDVLLSERLASVGGRLYFALMQFFQREPVEDSLLFVAAITTLIWFISLASGYWWTRHNNYLAAVLPGGIFTLVIHLYDQFFSSRIWIVAFYLLLSITLLGHLYHLKNRESWKKRRVFQMQGSTFDLTRGMMIAATLFVVVAWTVPASRAELQSAARTWKEITQPWRDVQEWFSNAVESLQAPVVRRRGDLYGDQLGLGSGNPLSEAISFSVEVTNLEERPPRFYWRGYIYDFYQNSRWYTTGSRASEFSPSDTELNFRNFDQENVGNFIVRTQIQQSLLYTPAQPLWVSRPGRIEYATIDTGGQDLLAWLANPSLLPGEQYQVIAALSNPSKQQLQQAGTDYPQWVLDRYLQLPENFSPRIIEQADQISQGLESPFEKAVAITSYLRNEIEYVNPLPESPPEDEDILEWILFDLKQGFCNYYASIEVLMLRSQGIPARMAVGFAQGDLDQEANAYIVQGLDAHAWPEVYFPGIGWVEFEPTGNQNPLVRPDRPEEDEAPDAQNPQDDAFNPLDLQTPDERLEELLAEDSNGGGSIQSVRNQAILRFILYLAISVLFVSGVWLLNRQYSIFDQIPGWLQTSYERNGRRAPAWLANWARWAKLTSIERSFETINRSLRLLGESPARFVTPSERASSLSLKLPNATNAIETLVEQHQASLFTPASGSTGRARRASLVIWLYTIKSMVDKFLSGLKRNNSISG
jgi:transglutaminase-like putative cysteine protease